MAHIYITNGHFYSAKPRNETKDLDLPVLPSTGIDGLNYWFRLSAELGEMDFNYRNTFDEF